MKKTKKDYEHLVGQLFYNTTRYGEPFERILYIITGLVRGTRGYEYLYRHVFTEYGDREWSCRVESAIGVKEVVFITGPSAGELPSWLQK